jgi:hypothetical protein
MKPRLSPIPFFAGLIVGLACLSWLGATVKSPHLQSNFVRYHQKISPGTGYFPTPREFASIVGTNDSAMTKVYVIIGGSSVFNGVGQHESLVWTRALQKLLGAEFRVINLAQQGSGPPEAASMAAEWLLVRSQPVIYVTIASPRFMARYPDGGFQYFFFDAWHHGFLLPWSPRERLLRNAVFDGPSDIRVAALGSALDSYLNFKDLWNYFSYEIANPNWNFILLPNPFLPRFLAADPEPTEKDRVRYSLDFERMTKALRGMMQDMSDLTPLLSSTGSAIDEWMPNRLRAVTLAGIHLWSPYYVKALNLDEQQIYLARANDIAQFLGKVGIHRALVPTTGFTADDYVDALHLSVTGGTKVAGVLAPEIRTMARDLGYIP